MDYIWICTENTFYFIFWLVLDIECHIYNQFHIINGHRGSSTCWIWAARSRETEQISCIVFSVAPTAWLKPIVFSVWTKRHKRFASVWQVENCYASRSVSLKTGASAVMLGASVGAAGLGGLKTFQGLEGQRRGSSGTTSAAGEADGLAAVVSSSEDSSLATEPGGSTFLSGVQPGGRRLLKGWEGVSTWINCLVLRERNDPLTIYCDLKSGFRLKPFNPKLRTWSFHHQLFPLSPLFNF